MDLPHDSEVRLNAYLKQVERALPHAPAAERADIILNAREQIEAAYAAGGQAGFEAELRKMASPRGYLESYPPPAGLPVAWPYWIAWPLMILSWVAFILLLMVSPTNAGPGPELLEKALPWAMLFSLVFVAAGDRYCIGGGHRGVRLGQVAQFGVLALMLALSTAGWRLTRPAPARGARGVVAQDPPRVRWDKTDLPFVDDPALPGEWKSVGFAREPDDFFGKGGDFAVKDLYLTSITAAPGGKSSWYNTKNPAAAWPVDWTKGTFLDRGNQTAPAYRIQEKDGRAYLFVEWKSGDYTRRAMTPQYYVLERQ